MRAGEYRRFQRLFKLYDPGFQLRAFLGGYLFAGQRFDQHIPFLLPMKETRTMVLQLVTP